MTSKFFYLVGDVNELTPVHKSNGKSFGSILMECDGFYYWWPPSGTGGCVDAETLGDLSLMISSLNVTWQTIIDNDRSLNEPAEPRTSVESSQGTEE